MSARRVYVINPNSSEKVTEVIQNSLGPFAASGVDLACLTSRDGPPAIETDRDVELSIPPMLDVAEGLADDAASYVIACFSDPGLADLRSATRLPVFGIQESSVSIALSTGARFGVAAILPASVERQRRSFMAQGVTNRWAGSIPLGLGVAELADRAVTLERLTSVARSLRDDHGADSIILGCAGMGAYRKEIEAATGVPVIDPVQAAATLAVKAVSGALEPVAPDSPVGTRCASRQM